VSTISRILAVAALALAAAFASAPQADAHTGDALHQHTWSALYQAIYPAFRCNDTFDMYGTIVPGSVAITMPDQITSPSYDYVYYTARLERWNGPNVAPSVVGDAPWARHIAGRNGPDQRYAWMEIPSGRRIPNNVFSWNAGKGWYRVHHYFSWAADGTCFTNDTTAWCEVR
jgi:hypothetical protein